ncbi:MAG: ubiquinol-cytochrome C chaperone family protein [Alphaproteobacteria bacterium]
MMSPLAKIRNWLKPAPEALVARALFTEAMAAARTPEFYLQGGVADSIDGRFDLVVVHLILIMHRLKREGEEGKDLAQRLFDIAFANFDEALREMGVGDLTVPKRIRKMAEAFYGRIEVYEDALATGGEAAFAEALRRNLYRGKEISEPALAWTAEAILGFLARLEASTRAGLLSGRIANSGAAP